MPRFPFILLFMVFSLTLRQSAGEPPKVNFFFPAGAARGQTISVTASGTFKEWPVHAWVDRTGLEIQAEKDKGKLKVAVAADAECGVYWLRLHDKSGASALRPFVVGTLPTMEEKEPNDDPRKPQVLGESFVVNGKLSKAGDVDGFSIALKEGQTLVASLQASQVLASPMDGVLQVCNERGIVLAQNDDARGTDPLVVFRAPYGGTFLVRTFAFPQTPNSTIGFAGADTFVYRLTITSGPFLDHTFPLSLAKDASTLALQGWNIPEAIATVRVESSKGKNTATVFHPQIAGLASLHRSRD